MTLSILRRFRAPLIGVVALVFSAGIAFAGQPTSTGLDNAASHAGKTVPVAADEQAGDQTEETTTEETTTEETTTEDTTDSTDQGTSDHCNVDLTQDPAVLATLNHGSVVCTAAHQDPPAGYSADGYANHGAWVSSFAKGTHGASQSANGKSHNPNH